MASQFSFTDKLKYQLAQKIMERLLSQQQSDIEIKKQKIAQLEGLVRRYQMAEIEENIAIEEQVQCSIEPDLQIEEKEQIRRLSQRLVEREEQGVRLHLVSFQKSKEIQNLNEILSEKQRFISQLTLKLKIHTSDSEQQEETIHSLQTELHKLKLQLKSKEKLSKDNLQTINQLRSTIDTLTVSQQKNYNPSYEALQYNKNMQIQEIKEEFKMEMKSMVSKNQKDLQFSIMEKFQENCGLFKELEKMKNILNNYDWKLFCIETELDLSNKQKKQYKYLSEKHEIKISQLQNAIKEQRITMFSHEQEIQFYKTQNQKQSQQLCQLYHKIQVMSEKLIVHTEEIRSLQTTIESMNDEYKDEDIQELKYQLKEKTQEHNELIKYVKEKSKQNHDLNELNQKLNELIFKQKSQNSKLSHHISELSSKILSMNELKTQYDKVLDQFTQNIQNLQIKHYESQQDIIQYQLKIQQLTEQKDNYHQERQELTQMFEEQNNKSTLKLISLQINNNFLKSNNNHLTKEMSELVHEIDALADEVKVLQGEKEEMEIDYHEMKALNGYYIKKIDENQRKISKFQYKIMQAQNDNQFQVDQCVAIRKESQQLLETIDQIKRQNNYMERRIQKMQTDQQQLMFELENAQTTKGILKIQLQAKVHEMKQLQEMYAMSMNNVKNLTQKVKVLEIFQSEHIKLYIENENLMNLIQNNHKNEKSLVSKLNDTEYQNKQIKSVNEFLIKQLQSSEYNKNQVLKSYNKLHNDKSRLEQERVQLNQKFILQTIEINNMKQQIREMHEMTNLRITEMNTFLNQQELKKKEYEEKVQIDNSITFQILAQEEEEDFQVIDERTSKSCHLMTDRYEEDCEV